MEFSSEIAKIGKQEPFKAELAEIKRFCHKSEKTDRLQI
ncbi:hypothetical protein HMPREF1128_0239 [Haemophilus sputorum HK 2154]|nr:hypothetical protein HMPREF1128_0239 [Haemophilus sputorum HK 2154]